MSGLRRAAVLGSPIGHSLSPALHRAAYEVLDLDWSYDAIEVTQEDLPGFLAGLGPEWAGLSLTMPLKTAVLPLLADRASYAVLTGAVNTVVFTDHGPVGYNTDVRGVVTAVQEAARERLTTASTATILGAGATARSVLAALEPLGPTDAVVVARRPEATADLRLTAEGAGVRLRVVPWDDAPAHLHADLVVSTVPAGVADGIVDAVPAHPRGPLLDVVYAGWPTALARAWQAHGGVLVNPLAMLLHQAAGQVELMTGLPAPVDAMRAALPTPA